MTDTWRLERTKELKDWYRLHTQDLPLENKVLLHRIMLAAVVAETRQQFGKECALEWLSFEVNHNMDALDRIL